MSLPSEPEEVAKEVPDAVSHIITALGIIVFLLGLWLLCTGRLPAS